MDHAFGFEFPRHVHLAVQQASDLVLVLLLHRARETQAVSKPTSFLESLKNIKQNTAKIEAKF